MAFNYNLDRANHRMLYDKNDIKSNFKFYYKNDDLFYELDSLLSQSKKDINVLELKFKTLKKHELINHHNFEPFLKVFELETIEDADKVSIKFDKIKLKNYKPSHYSKHFYSMIKFILYYDLYEDCDNLPYETEAVINNTERALDNVLAVLTKYNELEVYDFQLALVPLVKKRSSETHTRQNYPHSHMKRLKSRTAKRFNSIYNRHLNYMKNLGHHYKNKNNMNRGFDLVELE